MNLEIGRIGFRIGRGQVGLLDCWIGVYGLSFAIGREFRQWGYSRDWYDGYLYAFGLGPFLLATWADL